MWMGIAPARRLRSQVDVAEADRVAVHAGPLLRPQGPHGGDRLLGPLAPPLERDAQGLELLLQPADADPEGHPAGGEVVEGGQLLGQDQRIALRGGSGCRWPAGWSTSPGPRRPARSADRETARPRPTAGGPTGRRGRSTGSRPAPPRGRRSRSTRTRPARRTGPDRRPAPGSTNGPMLAKAIPNFIVPPTVEPRSVIGSDRQRSGRCLMPPLTAELRRSGGAASSNHSSGSSRWRKSASSSTRARLAPMQKWGPEPKARWWFGLTVHPELERVGEHLLVAVGRGVEQRHPVAGADRHAPDVTRPRWPCG